MVRGALDRLVGGAGRRWPAPDRDLLRAGDEVGFWRVTGADEGRLDLEAAVRAPGRVTLTTTVTAEGPGTRLDQRVSFGRTAARRRRTSSPTSPPARPSSASSTAGCSRT